MKSVIRSFSVLVSLCTVTACSSLSDLDSNSLGSLTDGVLASANVPTGTITSADVTSAKSVLKGFSVTDEQVQSFAKDYIAASDHEHKVAPSDNPYAKRLMKLVKSHLHEDNLKLDFKVYLAPEVNAFSLANGSVRVYSGLMDRLNDAELLSVLGHEIGHVKLGHSKSQLQKAYIASGLIDSGSNQLAYRYGGAGAGMAGNGISVVSEQVKAVMQAQFSQADENDADDYSLSFLMRHHYDQAASVRALRKIATLSEDEDSFLSSLTSSHPAPNKRADRLAAQLKEPSSQKSHSEHSDSPASNAEVASANTETGSTTSVAQSVARSPIEVKKQPATFTTWVIQVAAEEEELIAREKVNSLAESAIKATVQRAEVRGKTYFRVLVGPYRSKASAQEDLERITNFDVNLGTPFIKKETNS